MSRVGRWLGGVRPYLPVLVILVAVAVLSWRYQRELGDWFAGRPFGVPATSRPVTLDAGPFRVAFALRPTIAVAADDGDNALYIGVGDADGALLGDASVTVDGRAAQGVGMGQFDAVLRLEGARREVPVVIERGGERGAVTIVIERDKAGVRDAKGSGDDIAWWTCAMHPSVHAPEDGLCPICRMDLVPVTQAQVASGRVELDARRRQLIGVTSARVERRALRPTLVAGAVAVVPEDALADVTPRAAGWATKVEVGAIGERVETNQVLAEITSPELFAAESEHLAAVGIGGLAASTRERLRLLGRSDGAIDALEKQRKPSSRIVLRAPIGGVILAREIVQGGAVAPDRAAFRIARLDPIWLEARLYELDQDFAEVGVAAVVTLPGGERRAGAVAFVAPEVDPESRTTRVRVAVPNPDGRIRPGAFAEVVLERPRPLALVVPREAVIRTGRRDVVFVDRGGGAMEPTAVTLGARDDDGFEIIAGLAEGDVVVTSGTFLLAAESRLRAADGGLW